MKTEILFAGFGGQGILLMGKITAQAAMATGLHTTYLPSYGPEMRGGTANCGVVISDADIASPIVDMMDVLVAMNQPSFDKFAPQVRAGGLIVYDETLVAPSGDAATRVRLACAPFTQIAGELGNVRVGSMAALGRFVRETKLVTIEVIAEQMRTLTAGKQALAALNERALTAGYQSAPPR